MKKISLISIVTVIILVVAVYVYFRYSILNTRDFKLDKSASKSILDLRPELIAKLQQVVKDGSDGLYNLSVLQIEPDIIESKLKVVKAILTPDTTVLARLDDLKKAPDDVFKISIDSFYIDGIGIGDFLSVKNINLEAIFLNSPVINVYHNERLYNKEKRAENDSTTLYQKLTKQFTSISIAKISIQKGAVITHNLSAENKITRYSNINVSINDLRIDSSTQYDKSRFFYAKEADISISDYSMRTGDSLYFLKCKSLNISAVNKTLTAKNIELIPRGSKQQFRKKLKERKDMFTIKVPELTIAEINWWSYVNSNRLIAKQADIYNCSFYDFLNKKLPPKKFKINNYPHQALMTLKIPVFLERINLHNMDLIYQELNPQSAKTGTLYFDNITGQIKNFTNIAHQINKNKHLTFKVHTKFMHKVPVSVTFNFNLAKNKTGEFSTDVNAGNMDTSVLNALAEPLGLFTLKKGNVKKLTAHIRGNNFKVSSTFLLLYNDLYIVPLKKDENSPDGLKKKKFTGFLANILIKNSNPNKRGEIREYRYVVERKEKPNFFNQLWKTLLMGVIKTIGAPEKFAE